MTTTDSQVAAKLRTLGEGRRFAAIIKPVFAREASCVWLEQPAPRAQVEARVARALTDAFVQDVLLLAGLVALALLAARGVT